MLRRIIVFILTNLAVVALISIVLSIFHVQPYLTYYGLDYQALFIYAAVVGFSGALISLMLSKFMAKMMFGIKLVDSHHPLYHLVEQHAQTLGLQRPEVGIFDSPEPNAFATGWNRNAALVAVSTGLLQTLREDEIEGVIGHELSHVANGDMVTMTLIQGIVNTFVIFFARIAAFAVAQVFRSSDDKDSAPSAFAYYMTSMVFELLFGIFASMIVMWFSRQREFRADSGSARLVGKQKMIRALQRLQAYQQVRDPQIAVPAFAAFKIANGHGFLRLFMSHPPLEERIAALENSGVIS